MFVKELEITLENGMKISAGTQTKKQKNLLRVCMKCGIIWDV